MNLKSILRRLSYVISFFAILFVALSFTSLPYWAYFNLAVTDDGLSEEPDYIVVMGGDGMPSPSSLIRSYFGIEKAKRYDESSIILALPYSEYDSTKQLSLLAHEFVRKGIDTNRLILEPNGFNTYSQVQEIAKMIPNKSSHLLIVTSPEHMYRCLATFRKEGMRNVGGDPTFESPVDEKKLKDKNKNGSRVDNLDLRYNIWSHMQYEIIVLREYVAITYYWCKGWI